jgi:hypothetical protein
MFPLLQIVGMAGTVYAFINNTPSPELRWKVYVNAVLFIGISSVYAFFRVKYKMKKGLFEGEYMDRNQGLIKNHEQSINRGGSRPG